jgi:hypothetical protein
MIEIRVRTEADREAVLTLQRDHRLGELFPDYVVRFEHTDGHVSTIAGGSSQNGNVTIVSGSPHGMGGGGGGGGGNVTIEPER